MFLSAKADALIEKWHLIEKKTFQLEHIKINDAVFHSDLQLHNFLTPYLIFIHSNGEKKFYISIHDHLLSVSFITTNYKKKRKPKLSKGSVIKLFSL